MRLSKLARIYEFGGEDKFYYVVRHSILNKSFLFSEEEYEDLKSKTLIKLRNKHNFSKVKEESDTNKVRLRILLKFLMKNQKVKPAYIAELLAVHRTTIYKMLKVKKDKK